ncbi:sensor histidine kinase [Paenibacillus sp. GCM10027626]|uniref:sensor histidine kinase n=1 Tax=Paenibacillus sp. GCM10027626 TaxID=3273411 RepID=UPI00362A677D
MERRRAIPITTKILFILLLILISLYAVTLIVNQMATDSISKEITKSVQSRDAFYLNSVETEVSRISSSLLEFVTDMDLIELGMSESTTDYFSRTSKVRAVQRRLKLLRSSSSLIQDVKVFVPQMNRTLETANFQSTIADPEYQELAREMNHTRIVSVGEQLFMSMRYPSHVVEGSEPLFVIAVEIDRTQLLKGLHDIVTPEHGNSVLAKLHDGWMVTNDSSSFPDEIMQSLRHLTDQTAVEAQVETLVLEGKRHYVSYRLSREIDMALIAYIQEDSLLGPLQSYKKWVWIILLLSVLITVLFSLSLYRVIHAPLKKLVIGFRKVEEGELVPIEVERRRDEFNYLFMRFNNMVSRLSVLIHEVYEQEIRSRRSELKALQSQINPHFLYNCFFILDRLIQVNDTERAGQFSGYLGAYFRFITRNGLMMISLEQEMQHARAYIDIQLVCYGSRIDVEYEELDDSYNQIKVPRLIVQPLLENAFKYAVEQSAAQAELWIHGEARSGWLSVMVDDNGRHLTDMQLQELQAKLSSSLPEMEETTGLINVHRRIQLMYGSGSGVYVTRSQLGGLCAEIRIPLEQREEYGDV